MASRDYKLHIWRQASPESPGVFKSYEVQSIEDDTSFLEMLDILNEQLEENSEEPVTFDHDCREGICGACSLVIDGVPHGPETTTTCQLHMRSFADSDTGNNTTDIYIEPWRAAAFPILKDLMVDRSSFDRIIQSGGFISVNTGSAPEANSTPVPKDDSDTAFDAATCIGCGACVAACKNASAMLFVSAKVSHMAHLPQGDAEKQDRVLNMVNQMDAEGFGSCTNYGECEAVCPKQISTDHISVLNREFLRAKLGRTT